MDNESKEIAYYILQNKYLEGMGISKINDNHFREINKYFPNDWFSSYNIDTKIRYISCAIKQKITLEEVLEKESEKQGFIK